MAGINQTLEPLFYADPGRSPGAFTHVAGVPRAIVNDPLALDIAGNPMSGATTSPAKKVVTSQFQKNEIFYGHAALDWFESFHVIPRAFNFGNILSDQSVAIEVFSGFRRATHQWTVFVNNAGVGVTLGGEPILPVTIHGLEGIQMTLDVSTSGDPFVDETLDFTFDNDFISVPIEIQRIVLWGLRPEKEYTETLSFLTDVQRAQGGNEKRPSLRKNPRQTLGYRYMGDEGVERQTLENLLFDWQARTFGVPIWFDECFLAAQASAGALVLTVDSTTLRDFRVGGLVAVFVSQTLFDVTEITAKTSTTISLNSPLLNTYPIGTSVFPLRVCEAKATISGERYPVNVFKAAIDFLATDNDVSLANLAPFSSFNGKLLLDNGNSVLSTTVHESFYIELIEIDNEVGLREVSSLWTRHKRGHALALRAQGRQAVWELRGLCHALRGRQISFYIPRDSDDLLPTANLLSGSNTLTISAVGYAQFVRNRQPKNVIRVNFVSGATPLLRTVTGSSAPSPGVEQLVLDANWPSTFTPAQISRIEYVEKVRSDTDDMTIEFRPQDMLAHLVIPLQAVFE